MIFWPSVSKWNQVSWCRMWTSVSWDLANSGVRAGHWSILGTVLARWGLQSLYACSTILPLLASSFSWLPQLLSLKTIWIFWESVQTQPFYLLGNGEHLGLELSLSAWLESCCSSAGQKHVSAQHTHLASLESETGWKVCRWIAWSQCRCSHFPTLITILFQGWAVITTKEQHDNLQP